MPENPWTNTDIGILNIKLHTYTLQMLIAKGLVSTADVQNMANQLYANTAAQPDTDGMLALARQVLNDIPGVTIR